MASRVGRRAKRELAVKIRPFGPSAEEIGALAAGLLEHRDLKARLGRTRHRLLSVELIEPDEKLARPQPPEQFRATIYDYTNQRTLRATGPIATPRRLVVEESGAQPLPSADEFAEAVSIVARHGEFKRKIADGALVPYPPMPPLVGVEQPDGRTWLAAR
jgi:hypothetical protein